MTTKPQTETELLGALRASFRNMSADERRGGFDLHGLLKGLEGAGDLDVSPLSDSAYYTLECTLIDIKGEEADLLDYQNYAPHGSVQALITRAHVAGLAQDEAFRRATANPTARELRDRLFQVQDQDVPLTDAEIAALTGRQ
jgi:hypothetical protein